MIAVQMRRARIWMQRAGHDCGSGVLLALVVYFFPLDSLRVEMVDRGEPDATVPIAGFY